MGDFDGNLIKQKNDDNNTNYFGSYSVGSEIVRSSIVDYILLITESDYAALTNPDPKILYLLIEDV